MKSHKAPRHATSFAEVGAKTGASSELKIRESVADNSKIIFLIYQQKHML